MDAAVQIWTCGHSKQIQEDKTIIHVYVLTWRLLFAGVVPLGPRVIKLGVPSASTLVEPSTARSATIGFAGLLELAALGTSSNWKWCLGRDRCARCGV